MKAVIYSYFDKHTEECVYIGIDTSKGLWRHRDHITPSKKKEQTINTWLQDRKENVDWVYVELLNVNTLLDEKDMKNWIHLNEQFLIDKYKPALNVYGNETNKRGK